MYQAISTILIILTILACVTKPQLHKTFFVYDSSYKITETKTTDEDKDLPKMAVSQQVEKTTLPKTETKVTVNTTPQKATQTKKQNSQTQQTVKNSDNISKTKPAETKSAETKTQPKATVQPKTTSVKQNTQTISQTEKERQEIIMWNVWRSNLQNKIMQDTKLPIMPEGIVFRFVFDVDKYGKISNVQTWSLTPAYTPYAIQYIAPVIRSYQGREILNFPEGSNRISTTVEGGWKISKQARFSTPADFKDSEKVIKR